MQPCGRHAMKKLVLSLAVLLVLAAGFFAVSPYISVLAIQKGVANDDSATLIRYIDFPVLRQNVKEQLRASSKKENEAGQNNFVSALMNGFRASVIDSMVETLVTPENLASVMSGKRSFSLGGEKPPAEQAQPENEKKIFSDARFTYDSFEQFSVWVPDQKGVETQLVLQRRGLVWKLVNIIFPSQKS
jgi:hypothetical protein